MNNIKLADYAEPANRIGWGGLLEWKADSPSNSYSFPNPYIEGLTITEEFVNKAIKGEFVDLFIVGAADPRTQLVPDVHLRVTTAVRPVATQLFGVRNFSDSPLGKDEFLALLSGVKNHWSTVLGSGASDKQIAMMMIMDEIITRRYRRSSEETFAEIFNITVEQVKNDYSLANIVYYANVSYSHLRKGKIMTTAAKRKFLVSPEEVQSKYLSHSYLTDLGVSSLPFELVQSMVRGKAFPELEIVYSR